MQIHINHLVRKLKFPLSLNSPKHPCLSVKCAVSVTGLEAHDSIKAKHVFQHWITVACFFYQKRCLPLLNIVMWECEAQNRRRRAQTDCIRLGGHHLEPKHHIYTMSQREWEEPCELLDILSKSKCYFLFAIDLDMQN